MGAIMYMSRQYGGGGSEVIDGSSITPTDDISIWLACAELTEPYTTLLQVLADDDVMEKLFRSENASDYLVRSTTWASDITADQTAMILIGKNDYCADTLLSDSTWSMAISGSAYFESVLNIKVPAMTSNTTPKGEAGATSYYSDLYAPWKAFDQYLPSGTNFWGWAPSSVTNQKIWYHFNNKVNPEKFALYFRSNTSATGKYITGNFVGSNDGTNWTNISESVSVECDNSWHYFESTSDTAYEYLGFYVTTIDGTATNGVKLQFYGRALKTTIYSAANDIVSFIDDEGAKVVTTDATGKGEVTIICKPNTDITFTSSIAKDPNNLSENYSKVVTVKTGEPVYVMPNKNVLYWFGYKSDNLQDISSANGWSGSTFNAPTYSTNKITFTSSSGVLCGVGNKNALVGNTKLCEIYKGITSAGAGQFAAVGSIAGTTSKSVSSPSQFLLVNNTTLTYAELVTSGSYVFSQSESGRSKEIYALWYNGTDDDSKAEITSIAYNEDGATCKNPNGYKLGEHFYRDGYFCTCIASGGIAYGATFTLGTNYVEGTVADSIGGYIDVDLRNTAVTSLDNITGHYYGSLLVSCPTNAVPYGWCWLDSWEIFGVSVIKANSTQIKIGLYAKQSCTFPDPGFPKYIRVFYKIM